MDTQFWQSFERQKVDGKYHLQRLLGNGAFGGVFLAQEMIGGQVIGEVAVKLILPISSNQAAQLGELIAMRNLNHPHVVRGLVVFHGRIRGNTLEGFPCARKHIMSSCLPSSV